MAIFHKRAALCSTAIFLALSAAPAGAHAQTKNAERTATDTASSVAEVVVTGSHIVRRDYQAESPIVTLSTESLKQTGLVALGESLNQMPQFAATASATQSGQGGFANGGRTLANLRGLGSARTLVLLDGRRIQPSDIYNVVDLNIVPDALIENVEIITGGASATYGSDALAGVINFKTRQSFSGLKATAQFGGTTDGGGANQSYTATIGANSADDRGNVVLSLGYTDRSSIGYPQRKGYEHLALIPFPGTGVVFPNVANLPTRAGLDQVFAKYGTAPNTVPTSASFGFNNDGTVFNTGRPVQNLKPAPGVDNVLLDGAVNTTGAQFLLLQAPLKKYNIYTAAHYDVAPGIQAYGNAFYSTYTTEFVSGYLATLQVPVTNPFIPADFRQLLASRPNPNASFTYLSFSPLASVYRLTAEADVWQITGGLRGNLPIRDWTYDVNATTGRSTTTENNNGLPDRARFNAAVNAADGGASLCAGGLNLFPFNTLSPECRKALLRPVTTRTQVEQDTVDATVQGGLFDLPAGELRFAVGASYRKNAFDYAPDPALQIDPVTGLQGINASLSPPVSPGGGATSNTDIYGELLIPILSDMPFANRLEANLGYRYSDYDISGGVSSYKADGNWEPVKGVLIRGGYQRSIRAPSPGELFAPSARSSDNIGTPQSGGGDPCSINGKARTGPDAAAVTALCVAQGVPASLVGNFVNTATIVSTNTAGNVNLTPETGSSWTIGAVLQPSFANPWISGMSLSADYYNIQIEDAIGTVLGGGILNKCFNVDGSNPTYALSNQYCQLIERDPTGQFGSVLGAIRGVKKATLNLADYEIAGVDVQLDWTINLADVGFEQIPGRVKLNTVVTNLRNYKLRNTEQDPSIDFIGTIGNNQIGGYSHPRWKTVSTLTYGTDELQVGGRWRHISEMGNSLNVNTTQTQTGTPSVDYFDLFGSYILNENFTIRAGVTNVANKRPPFYSNTYPFTDGSTFDSVGRSYYISATATF
ncbi:MAG: TonB-dependent receptor [Sulfuritalea sp.]|nr:TonB-dependent receptor [Sulfuritalea sp.]